MLGGSDLVAKRARTILAAAEEVKEKRDPSTTVGMTGYGAVGAAGDGGQCASRCFLTATRDEGIRVAKTGVPLRKQVHARIEVHYAGSAASVQPAGNCPVGGRGLPGC